jgi:hypothetical protein
LRLAGSAQGSLARMLLIDSGLSTTRNPI